MRPCLQQSAQPLAALADATRREILDALSSRGEATATVLADDVPVSRQAIVKHLAILDAAGLVRGRKQGREVRYGLVPLRLEAVARCLADVATEWDRRLLALKRIAEAAEVRRRR